MLLDLGLVREQSVQRSVESIVVDLLARKSQQILHRCPPIPALGNVKLTRGLAEPCDHQNRDHLRPGQRLPSLRQQFLAESVEPKCPPKCPGKPDISECSPALQTNPVQLNRDGLIGGRFLEEIALIESAGDCTSQCSRLGPSTGVQFSKLRDRLLDHLAVTTHGTDEAPVDVRLAVLANRRMSEVHGSSPLHVLCSTGTRATRG